MSSPREFEYLNGYCSFLDDEITVIGEYAVIRAIGMCGTKFISHNCPHHDECQRDILECELATLGRSKSR